MSEKSRFLGGLLKFSFGYGTFEERLLDIGFSRKLASAVAGVARLSASAFVGAGFVFAASYLAQDEVVGKQAKLLARQASIAVAEIAVAYLIGGPIGAITAASGAVASEFGRHANPAPALLAA